MPIMSNEPRGGGLDTGDDESLLRFPCSFPIKAMGRVDEGIESLVVGIIRRHVPGLDGNAISRRISRRGNWVAITVVIEAREKAQLDAIYRELSAEQRIVCAL